MPNDVALRNKWIEAIRRANNDNYSGAGVICDLHFPPNEMKTYSDRIKLDPTAVPSVFVVKIVDHIVHEEDDFEQKYVSLRMDHDQLKKEYVEMRLESDLKIIELGKKLSSSESKIDTKIAEVKDLREEILRLMKANASLERNYENVREKLLLSHSSSKTIAVSHNCVAPYFYRFR